jgi:hypothetical protein
MKTTIMNFVAAGLISLGAAAFAGCAAETTTAYNPPVAVVHEPTALTTVPATADTTTSTTQYSNGTVEKQTTTQYNPAYTTLGAPYKTTVVPVPGTATTTTTTVGAD